MKLYLGCFDDHESNPDNGIYRDLKGASKTSSDMTPADWQRIADDIGENYDDYDGFVILHGTDTMAYSASALSYAVLRGAHARRKPSLIAIGEGNCCCRPARGGVCRGVWKLYFCVETNL